MNLKVVKSSWWDRTYLRHLDCKHGHIRQKGTTYYCSECKQELKDPYYLCMLMFNMVQPIIEYQSGK